MSLLLPDDELEMRTATIGRITSSLDATVFIIVAASHKVSPAGVAWAGVAGFVVGTDMRGVGAGFVAAGGRDAAVDRERER